MSLQTTEVFWYANVFTGNEWVLDEFGIPLLDENYEPIVSESWVGDEWTLDGSQLNELDTGGVLDGDRSVDLSDYVANGGISIQRGRTDAFADFSPGSATITFHDDDRRFDSMNSAGIYYGQLGPGKRVQIVTDGVTIMEGTVRSWRNTYRQNAPATVTLTIEDALARIGRRKFTAWTTTEQLPRQRFVDVMLRDEVAYAGAYDFDEGVFTLQSDSVSNGSSVLNYLQLVARSDLGRVFASRENTLTFRDRLTTSGSTAAVTFSEDGTGIDIESLSRTDDARSLFTRVTVDREGGIAQTAVNAQAEIDYDGARAFSLTGLLLNSDTDSESLADYLLGILSVPEQRIESITVKVPLAADALRPALLELELADVVAIVWTPQGIGPPIDTVAIVESIQHQITPFDHVMTIGLSAVENRSPWTLEDVLLGALDGVAVLSF